VATCGLDPVRDAHELSRHVGYLSQRFSLYGDLTVDENIAFFADVHGVRNWTAAPRRACWSCCGWTPFRDRLADRLSGGMKQKLALACTLIHTPELLVLDEPTTGVDPVSRRDFWKILARLQRDGLTLLLTTPYLDEAERCQRVGLMDHGRLLALDTPDRLRRSLAGVMLEMIAEPKRKAAELLAARAEVSDVETFGERLHLRLPDESPAGAEAAGVRLRGALAEAGIEVDSCRAIVPSLEDVFIARIRGGETANEEVMS
jgi:ABC-2 type transport system ATP-binding protein